MNADLSFYGGDLTHSRGAARLDGFQDQGPQRIAATAGVALGLAAAAWLTRLLSSQQQPPGFVTLAVRTAMDPTAVTSSIRAVVSGIDPDLPFYMPQTMKERVAESLVTRRTPMLLLMIFAGVALFLAAVGIYGVLAYSVTQRTRELGIRIALGSSPKQVFRMVISHGARLVGMGLAIGGLGSLGLVRLIQALLYNVRPADPGVLFLGGAHPGGGGSLSLHASRAPRDAHRSGGGAEQRVTARLGWSKRGWLRSMSRAGRGRPR